MSQFVDATGTSYQQDLDFWPPVVIPKEEIDAEIQRLASLPAPINGRRESRIVHPRATEPGLGLAPGISVVLSVLEPGERTRPIRHNSTQVNFCSAGDGQALVGGRAFDFTQYDVWNTPSYATYTYGNDGNELQARLTYSDAPLLEKLHVHMVEEEPPESAPEASGEARETGIELPVLQMTEDGAALMPYELLINPPTVTSRTLHWPWSQVKEHLDQLAALGEQYRGRRLYLLYNPMTGRTNGTTPNFFATITIRPPGIVDRPHRHISAAINYYFHGRGRSIVNGRRYEWKAGDLMLSAPGWAIHHHASDEGEQVYELTVQDQPLHIAMESLLWQEDLKRPPRVLGSQAGFGTNREQIAL
jgi:gentisate 1,2-dioxygenase